MSTSLPPVASEMTSVTTVVPSVGTNGPSAAGAMPDPDGATTLTVANAAGASAPRSR